MVSLLPEIFAGEMMLPRPGVNRLKSMRFLPTTTGVTSKCRGVGAVVVLLTPTSAFALPLPTREPFGQAAGPPAARVCSSQVGRPLVLSLNVFGDVIVSLLSVRLLSAFLIVRWIEEFFGFVFVPAFFGATVTFMVAAGAAPNEVAAKARAVSAANATTRYFRKGDPPTSGVDY